MVGKAEIVWKQAETASLYYQGLSTIQLDSSLWLFIHTHLENQVFILMQISSVSL